MIRKGATAIAAYDLCPRKWAFGAAMFEFTDGAYRWLAEDEGVGPGTHVALPAPPSPWQAVGTSVHAAIERYLRGTPLDLTTDAGLIAMAGTHLLPLPSPRLWVERSWTSTLGAHKVTGTWDLVDRDNLVLYDHKTTGDFQWVKSFTELAGDTQAVLYTWALGREEIDAQWTYFRRTKPYVAQAVRATVLVTDERLLAFERTLDAMQAAEGCDPIRDLPPNPRACGAFGGCPYQSRCALTLGQRTNPVSNVDAMKKAMQGINPPPTAAPWPPPPPPDDEPARPVRPAVPKGGTPPTMTAEESKRAAAEIAANTPKRRGRPPKVVFPPVVAQAIQETVAEAVQPLNEPEPQGFARLMSRPSEPDARSTAAVLRAHAAVLRALAESCETTAKELGG